MTTFQQTKEQAQVIRELSRIIEVFKASEGQIRPHFILSGESGSGKSFIIQTLAEQHELEFLEINAAQLTKEGTSGNSLSKALTPLSLKQKQLTIVFVDEFDKLFISGNNNSALAHETTNGVQNEFLKVLESDAVSVYGDYGKYINVSAKNTLFVFAGAFNGEENITLDRLRDFGVKTEFLGRVGLVFNTTKLSLESLVNILKNSSILAKYLSLFPAVEKDHVVGTIGQFLEAEYEKNTLGVRLVNTLIHQYFIKGGNLTKKHVKASSFQKTLTLH
jgi:ATP-dependent protease Clp ATPase subunit